jgi:hypothetical protein
VSILLLLKLVFLLLIVDIGLRFVGYAQLEFRKRKFKKQTKETQKKLPTMANGDVRLLNPLDLVSVSQVFELNPQKRYVFWFRQLLPDKQAEFIERSLKRLGLNFRIFVGPGSPNIYEVGSDGMTKMESKKPIIEPTKEKERREFNPGVDKPIQ